MFPTSFCSRTSGAVCSAHCSDSADSCWTWRCKDPESYRNILTKKTQEMREWLHESILRQCKYISVEMTSACQYSFARTQVAGWFALICKMIIKTLQASEMGLVIFLKYFLPSTFFLFCQQEGVFTYMYFISYIFQRNLRK